ncbi:MAG TPA: inorganic diphosphatase [Pseudoxanthomonas sp.]
MAHPLLAAQADKVPEEAVLAVEIPAGGSIKYELDAQGLLYVDRYLQMPMAYPANYGSMPRSAGQDGDPLDALVLTRAPIQPGALIRFRPVAVLRMVDAGVADDKIIGVPVDKIDPAYSGIRDVDDLPQLERDRIEAFFRVYKDLPKGRNPVQLDGFGNAQEAWALIEASLKRFRQKESSAE